jgi:hypothetical protein
MDKLLRRTVIMREYDYNKKLSLALSLYTCAEFEPCLRLRLDQERVLNLLKNPHDQPGVWESDRVQVTGSIYNLLWYQRKRFYNPDHIRWNIEEDDAGHVWIWHRSNTPRSRLGLATFEYHYQTRDCDLTDLT